MQITERSGSSDSYRYGFNGKELDNELKGEGNSYDLGARMYDPRIGRFFKVDPKQQEYPGWSPYVYAFDNPIRLIDVDGEGPGDPLHHEFLMTVAIDIYDYTKAQGASAKGALLVLAQASLESGYGKSAITHKDFNLFGVMGLPSSRKTSHGNVKDYSTLGGYAGATKDFFKRINKNWSSFNDLIKKEDFTPEDIDEAFNTGADFPTDAERMKGKYAYNADMDALGKNHYGEHIFKQIKSIRNRLVKSIDYQVKLNNKEIASIDSKINGKEKLSKDAVSGLQKKKDDLTTQNTKLESVKKEITEVK